MQRINRIRLEFKDGTACEKCAGLDVLIESDWNLKFDIPFSVVLLSNVLIESDWNLKAECTPIRLER